MKKLNEALESRVCAERIIVDRAKEYILKILSPSNLEKLKSKKGYWLNSIYSINEGRNNAIYEHSLLSCLKETYDKRFRDNDAKKALNSLLEEGKIKYEALDLSSAHNPDSNWKKVYYLIKKK